ncbi:hypothetical protein ADUPG1_008694 [Aduncisulcus paluster]|uniref:Uncharacterized protein n=1 Tax=Aduncisulcus paluster TaxID=2918883 RepID=A0ABQ5KSX1_9EUKA|nr:hypothetical protein ADUPG1_008694 [Aduncisulcus paluster]
MSKVIDLPCTVAQEFYYSMNVIMAILRQSMLRNVFSSSFLIAFRPFIRKCLQNTVNPILGTQCSLFLAELSNFTNHDIDFFQCPDLPDRIAQMSPYVFSSFVFVINSCCTQKSVFDIGSDTIDILKDGHKDRAFLRPFGTTISHRNFSLLAEVAPSPG